MARNGDTRRGGDTGTHIITKTRPKTKRPSLYKVLLLNGDYTPMDFVVYILERFFNKAPEEATRIMLHVHQKGVGICGVYTYEVAETKVAQVTSFARQHEHPRQCAPATSTSTCCGTSSLDISTTSLRVSCSIRTTTPSRPPASSA